MESLQPLFNVPSTVPDCLAQLFSSYGTPILRRTPKTCQHAVEELMRNEQVDWGLAVSTVLAALSVSYQGLIDVEIPVTGAIRPVSLPFIVIAESGARKSTCFRRVFNYIKQFEDLQKEQYLVKLAHYQAEYKEWDQEGKELETERKKLQKKGASTEGIKLTIELHNETIPIKPHKLQVSFENASMPAVLQAMDQNCQNVFLSSDEAAILTKGPALDLLPTVNKALDGDTLKVNRKDREPISICNPRMTLAMSLQLQPFNEFIKRNKFEALDIGFINRVLLYQVPPLTGKRLITDASVSWEHLPKLVGNLANALNQTVDLNGKYLTTRRIVKMTPEAAQQWIIYYNWVESNTGASGKYAHCAGHASKLAENVARMAALFQTLEEEEQITLTTLNGAIAMVNWFSEEFIRLVAPTQAASNSLSQVQLDANELNSKLFDRLRGMNIRFVSSAELLRFAPNHLRKDRRAKEALMKLLEDNHLREFFDGRTAFIDLLPQMGTNPFEWQLRVFKLNLMVFPKTHFKTPDPYSALSSIHQL